MRSRPYGVLEKGDESAAAGMGVVSWVVSFGGGGGGCMGYAVMIILATPPAPPQPNPLSSKTLAFIRAYTRAPVAVPHAFCSQIRLS